MGRVAVAGSLNLDLVVRAPRHPAPGETLVGQTFSTFPGGKGLNQSAAARRAGAAVGIIGRIGVDDFGQTLRRVLRDEVIDDTHVVDDPAHTTGIAAIQLDAAGQNTIIVVPGANGAVSPQDVEAASDAVAASAVVVLQGEIGVAASVRAAELARAARRIVIFNPAPVPAPCPDLDRLLTLSDYVLPNEGELRRLGGCDALAEAARRLKTRTPGRVVATLGERGALVLREAGEPAEVRASHAVTVVDTVGAGDAFVGAFAAALAEGRDPDTAVAWGLAAGALACTRSGALPSMPGRADILRLATGR